MDKIRDHHACYDRDCDDHKLFDRFFKRKPAQDHKTYAEEHTHIINDQPVSFRIDHAEQNDRTEQKNLLQNIKQQVFQFSRLEANHKKT